MAGASVAILGEPSSRQNPAGIARLDAPSLSLDASQAFGLPELRYGSFTVAWPIRRLTPSARIATFGYASFRTTSADVTISGRLTGLGGGLYGGVTVQGHHLSIPGYGNASAVTINLGWILTPLPGLHLGGSVDNVYAGRWLENDELPQRLRVGCAYVTGRSTLAIDVEKDMRFPISGEMGLEYALLSSILLRLGGATAPSRAAAGAGLRLARMHIDFAAERHYLLGWTPAVGMTVRL